MALLGTPQISTRFFPHDGTRSSSVDCAAKWESAGFLREAFRPGFWGVPNKYPIDYRRGTVLVEWRTPPRIDGRRGPADLLWRFGGVYPTGIPRRIAPLCPNCPPAIIGRASVGYPPQTVRAPRRSAPLHQNSSPATIAGVFVGYPPKTRAEGLTKEARTFPFRGEDHRKAPNFVVGDNPGEIWGVPNKAIFQNEGLLQSKPSF